MSNLKELRNRISSVTATRKITRAMQMVAASKLRRAQDAAQDARAYAGEMGSLMASLVRSVPEGALPPALASRILGGGTSEKHLLIVGTSERGLCGGFNTQIVRKVRAHAQSLAKNRKTFKILCVGKKGRDALKREWGQHIEETYPLPSKPVSFDFAREVADKALSMLEMDGFDTCVFFHARFVSVIQQDPLARRLVPVIGADNADADDDDGDDTAPDVAPDDTHPHEYEPDEAVLLGTLFPRNFTVQIFQGLLENAAGEQGARMSAMDSATRNAGEMIDKLTITYNRTRQAAITKELIEIISGAEAL